MTQIHFLMWSLQFLKLRIPHIKNLEASVFLKNLSCFRAWTITISSSGAELPPLQWFASSRGHSSRPTPYPLSHVSSLGLPHSFIALARSLHTSETHTQLFLRARRLGLERASLFTSCDLQQGLSLGFLSFKWKVIYWPQRVVVRIKKRSI